MTERIVGVIQARIGSTRLPGKALLDLCGKPVIQQVYDRLKLAALDDVVLAIADDAELVAYAESAGLPYFAGSEEDVIDRMFNAANKFKADAIVRITADCPFVDAGVVDSVVRFYRETSYGYVSNVDPATFPDGLDVEVYSKSLLAELWEDISDAVYRGSFAVYVWEHYFPRGNVRREEDLSHLRWTVDTQEDLDFARWVFGELGASFKMDDVLDLLGRYPEKSLEMERPDYSNV